MLWKFLCVQLQQCGYEIHAPLHSIDIVLEAHVIGRYCILSSSCLFFIIFLKSQIQILSHLTNTIVILLFLVTIFYK